MKLRLPGVLAARRAVQWVTTGVVVLIGVQFSRWVIPHLEGEWPTVTRPPAVEAFLPIDAMLGLRHWMHTGVVDAIHPAGLAIFLGICLMSLVLAKSFCSHLCPVGLLSELLGRLGLRLTGRTLTPPRWLDLALRGLKMLLLAFFVWAIWFSMDSRGVDAFLESPYARIVDAKMWLFFAEPTRLTIAVIGVLVVVSVFVRDAWCRYLCPYGALVGLLGRLAPLKVTRDPDVCTSCQACTRVCPARLPVHTMRRVGSIECTSCQDCVVACPEPTCLFVRPPRPLTTVLRARAGMTSRNSRPDVLQIRLGRLSGIGGVARPTLTIPRLRASRRRGADGMRKREAVPARALRPVMAVVLAGAVYSAVVIAFVATGHWRTALTEAEYHRRLQEIQSPLYTHVGGQAMAEAAPSAAEPGMVPSHTTRQ